MKKILLIASLAFFGAACKKPQAFDYREIRNLKIENAGFDKTTLVLDLVYFNPNGYGVVLKKVDCDVFVDSSFLGKFQLDTLMHIPRKAEFILPTRIVVNLKILLKKGLGMMFNKEVLINVKGTTRVGKSGFYKTVPFNYEAKQKLSLF